MAIVPRYLPDLGVRESSIKYTTIVCIIPNEMFERAMDKRANIGLLKVAFIVI